MSTRESFLTVNESLAAAPGPGHYTPGLTFHKTKGGGSLDSRVCCVLLSDTVLLWGSDHVSVVYKDFVNLVLVLVQLLQAERFPQPPSKAPGPGAYSISKSTDWLRKTYPPPANRPSTSRHTVSGFTHICTRTRAHTHTHTHTHTHMHTRTRTHTCTCTRTRTCTHTHIHTHTHTKNCFSAFPDKDWSCDLPPSTHCSLYSYAWSELWL